MAKVFVSHSSNDKDVVRLFKDLVLKSGFGLSDNDIFFTSSPETGVPVGENIPKYIKDNLIDCECVFLMISKDYKQSEVCLNEMGAAMVISKKLIPVLLYNFDFNNVGWLIDKNLCVRINDEERLDEIRDYFNSLGVNSKTNVWNRNRISFINELRKIEDNPKRKVRKGLLDYQQDIEDNQLLYDNTIKSLNKSISDCMSDAKPLIEKHNQSLDLSERKELLGKVASYLNNLAGELNKVSAIVDSALKVSINSVEEILQLHSLPLGEKESWINQLLFFKTSCQNNSKVLMESRLNIEAQTDMEEHQIQAKYRVLAGYDTLLKVYEACIHQIEAIVS